MWSLPCVQRVLARMTVVDLDMCCFGMKIPNGLPIKKHTRLLVSHSDMKSLAKTCPGPASVSHRSHQVIAGSHPAVGSVSKFAGRYPTGFVRAVMRTVSEFPKHPVLIVNPLKEHECLVSARVRELNEANGQRLQEALLKLHTNLGHPGNQNLVRILKHGGASQEAVEAARSFQCQQCLATAQPRPPLPAKPDRVLNFNQRIGVDVKYLRGWAVNQKIPAINIVDYASSFQMMVPIFKKETSEQIRQVIQERWINWAGTPDEIIMDPAKPNVSEALIRPTELSGSIVHITAADAHHQLGKVEVHGGWFSHILDRILHEQSPSNPSQWMECVHAAHCKNELIQVYGHTPAQFVLGRNPKIPENLLDEPLEVIPATASLLEESYARRVAIRQAARRAVLELQDSKALRLALAARPRHQPEFVPGTFVAYWRSQKWQQGTLDNQGRWHGPAIVLGKIGRNHIICHKKQLLRVAPEQLRLATQEEKVLLRAPHAELLGVKQLFESGELPSNQYVDLASQEYPTIASSDSSSAPVASLPPPATVPLPLDEDQVMPNADASVGPMSISERIGSLEVESIEAPSESIRSDPYSKPSESSSSSGDPSVPDETYGPVRRRLLQKGGPAALFRPAALAQDDLSELMREVVPQLLEQALASDDQPNTTSPRGGSVKRSSEQLLGDSEEPPASRSRPDPDESLMIQEVLSLQGINLDDADRNELIDLLCSQQPINVLMAAYHAKKTAKELPHSGNETSLQAKIDEAKVIEWNVIEGKNAGRLVLGNQAQLVRQRFSHRIMDSRFVITEKREEEDVRIKARWCLLGHKDPDLNAKAAAGDLKSPTLSQIGRNVLFQLIVSHQWQLSLGDIKGAFLAAGPLPACYRPLYASLPPGGIPGVPSDALVEVTGHVYGLNDSPSAWQKKLDKILREVGFQPSRFDPCFYCLRDQGKLVGVYGVHVDDCATGGEGPIYEKALALLRSKFEFRKWRAGDGDFCGSRYTQDAQSKEITMNQTAFLDKLKPLHFNRTRLKEKDSPLTEKEISCLRAINGSLNWLATQTRPDLATQVSFSQQSFPTPTVSDAISANNAIRRARQHSDMSIVFRKIDISSLAVVCHSDAAYANAKGGATQAGFVIGCCDKSLDQGETSCWTPIYWKSHRLPRVVNSTLSAEAQSMANASSMCEWVSLFLTEIVHGQCFSHTLWTQSHRVPTLLVTDCKSLFDHLMSPSAPTLDDRRTALDIVIIREARRRMFSSLRWIPTDRMIADGMTKESADALDLLRACVKAGKYQISPEDNVLEWRAQERETRKTFRLKNSTSTSPSHPSCSQDSE